MKKSAILIALIVVMVATPSFAQKKWKHTQKWRVGGWFVTHEWDDFEKSFTLLTFAKGEQHEAPGILISCTDGNFNLMILGGQTDKEARSLYSIILLSNSGKEAALPVHADSAVAIDVPAGPAEYLISNSRRIGIRFKYAFGDDKDYFYKLSDLAVGKPQLFNICPIKD